MRLIIRDRIHEGAGAMTSLWSHVLACDIFYSCITSSTMSKKLQDDGETATTTPPPAPHFPGTLLLRLGNYSGIGMTTTCDVEVTV